MGVMDFLKILRGGVKEITVEEAKSQLKEIPEVILLDVRELNEWQDAHIPGAKHIPLGSIEASLDEVCENKNTPVICQCAAGRRSLLAAQMLQKHGFKNVSSMAGGLNAWQVKGYETE